MTYDPVDMRVLWSDKRERAVYSIALDGGKRNTLLSASDGIGYVGSRQLLYVQHCHVLNVLVKVANHAMSCLCSCENAIAIDNEATY